jgi:cytochrome b561
MATADLAPTAAASPGEKRYGTVSIVLHWTIAALVLTQIGLGWYMNEVLPDHSQAQDQVQSLHISVGLTVLLLVLARIGVRLSHPIPPLSADTEAWERVVIRATHLAFYLLLLVMPLTGWAIVSAHKGPISFWGLPWPHLPGLGFLASPDNKPLRRSLTHFHVYILIWIALVTLALHVAGALRHQFVGQPVLWKMAPFLKRRD